VRRVIERCLDGVDQLLARASTMPPSVRHRGLRWESAFILRLARALSTKLRREDPLAGRVKVAKPLWAWHAAAGIVTTW
jgi:hypothetical protein